MTRSELVSVVMDKSPGLTRAQTEVIIEAFFKSIINALNEGDKVEIRGFGNFRVKDRNPRQARNPKTGAVVNVPAKRVLHFKMGKELRELINAS